MESRVDLEEPRIRSACFSGYGSKSGDGREKKFEHAGCESSRGRIVFRGWFKTQRVEDSFVGLEGEMEQLVYGFLWPYGRMKFSFVKGMG